MNMTAQQGLGLVWLLEQERGRDFFLATPNDSPWLHVDFPTGPDKYAIWNSTGSVYKCEGPYDEVPDDPIYTPPKWDALEKWPRAMEELNKQSDAIDALIDIVLGGLAWNGGHVQDEIRDAIEKVAPGRIDRLLDIRRVHAE